ncbi:ATPase inhibitor subunit zeta [Methylobacterium phyllosphaerae]
MTTFDERERAFERHFVQDEEQRFRARMRRNRLLALWACERMRLPEQAAERFVEAFTDRGVLTADGPLVAELQADLKAAGIEATLPDLHAEMARCAAVAGAELRVGVALDQSRPV